jgi:type IV secretion system protein VirB8
MRSQPDADRLLQELVAMRELIADHANVQQLLDFAAEEADRRAATQEHLRCQAWRVAAAFGCIAIVACGIAGGAIATSMRPAPPPEVLVVDRSNGLVQPLVSLAEFQISPPEATIRRNINTFVLAHEGYSYEQADIHYYTSAAFMSPQLQTQWAQKWDKSNLESPPRKYRKDQRVRVKIGAITLLRNGQGVMIGARAGFTKTELSNDVEQGQPSTWVATISFHWVNQPSNERDRRINDLGMEVTDYSVDRDVDAVRPTAAPTPPRQTSRESEKAPLALVAPRSPQAVTP